MQTRNQKFAEKAFQVVEARLSLPEKERGEYKSFAKRFPTLIHNCGLMQALAFAQTKNEHVLNDFIKILEKSENFIQECQGADMTLYIQTSRKAMFAASWLKRQADALIPDPQKEKTHANDTK